MAEGKYAHLFVTKPKENEARTSFDVNMPPPEARTRALYLDDEVIKGAFYVGVSWFWQATDKGPTPHVHDFSEALAFIGTNKDDITDLGGEVELWLGGEKYVMNKSFVCFIPGGLVHCPLKLNRVDRPILHFSIGTKGVYGGSEKK
jgi:hypothetical protein